MKQSVYTLTLLTLAFFLVLLLASWTPHDVSALPEYSAQTGDPCATCHISPSGGGNRAPRGQAWVASGKPAAVPDLMQSLDLLGVHLEVNPDDFLATGGPVPPARPPQAIRGQPQRLHNWLKDYQGN